MLYMYQVYHIFLEIVVKNFQSSSIELFAVPETFTSDGLVALFELKI